MSISAASDTTPRAAAAAGLDYLRRAANLLEKEYGQEEGRQRLDTVIRALEGIVDSLPGEIAADGEPSAAPEATQPLAGIIPVDELLEPITSEHPSGDNVRLSGEMNQLRSLTVNRARSSDFQPRWGESVSAAIELLRSRTKDLAVVTQLLESLIMSDRVVGLGDGFALLRGFLEKFWEDLYPEAEDDDYEMRSEDLARMQEVLTAALHRKLRPVHEYDPGITSPDEASRAKAEFDGILSQFDSMEEVINQRLGMEYAPNLGDLRKMLDGYRRKVTEVHEQYASQAQAAEQAQREAEEVQLRQEVEARDAEQQQREYHKALEEVLERLESAEDIGRLLDRSCAVLRAQEPSNPLPYRLQRARLWFAAGELPSPLPPPPSEMRQRLGSLLAAQTWGELLLACEEVFASGGHCWLDLQRLAWTAARGLGREYEPVAGAIARDLVDYVELHEELPESQLADMTPVADPETREWIADMTKALRAGTSSAAGAGDAGGSVSAQAARQQQVREKATRLIEDKRPVEAMQLIEEEEQAAKSGRDRFLWRLMLAELCVENQLEGVVLPSIDDLASMVREYRLENWESKDLLCRVFEAGFLGYSRTAGEDASFQEKVNSYYQSLCRLDPKRALRGLGTQE